MTTDAAPVRVVIPAHNEAGRLEGCLSTAVPAARQRGWTLVVVDDGSTDRTAELALERDVRVIRHERPLGVAAARNAGAADAEAAILLFLDADIVAPVSTLHALVDRLVKEPGLHTVGGYPTPSELNPAWGARFVGLRVSMPFLLRPGQDIVGFSSLQSECCAIRRQVFEEIGGFSEEHAGVGMEEFRLGHELERHGYHNTILAGAPYEHHYKALLPRCRELVRRTRRWVPLLLQRRRLESTGAVGSPRETVSCLLSGLLWGGLCLGLWVPAGWWVALLFFGAQVGLERRFLGLARRIYGLPLALFAVPALQVYHLAIAVGFGLGLVSSVGGVGHGMRPGAGSDGAR